MKRRRVTVVTVLENDSTEVTPKDAILTAANVLAGAFDAIHEIVEKGAEPIPAITSAIRKSKARHRAIRRAERRLAK